MNDARDYQLDPGGPDLPEPWVEIPELLLTAVLQEVDPNGYLVRQQFDEIRWAVTQLIDDLGDNASTRQLELLQKALAATNINAKLEERRGETTDIDRDVIVALIPYLREGHVDDERDVGITGNGWNELAAELEMLLDGKLTCPKCGGDGFVWSEEHFEQQIEKAAREAGVTVAQIRADDPYDEWGNVTCPKCNGARVIRVAQLKEK